MSHKQRVIARLSRLSGGVEYTDRRAGLTGKLDSNGNLIADVTQGLSAGLMWVRLSTGDAREATAVVNLQIENAANIPVLTGIRRDTGEREIIGLDPERAIATLGGAALLFSSPGSSINALTQTANTVFAGPREGAAQAPAFRVLAAGDVAHDITPTYDFTLASGKGLVMAKLVITDGVRWTIQSGAALKVV